MSLYIPSKKRVYLIDIYRLGNEAFSTINSDGKSLKSILESPDILKVLFDVRHDSDALFGLYGISVDGIRDVQLMELGTRTGSKEFLAGLKKCVEADSSITQTRKAAWGRTKDHARQLFDPSLGGRYEIFNERPIRQVIAEYCAGDVTLLPDLFNVYNAKLHPPERHFGNFIYWKQPKNGSSFHKVQDLMEHREPTSVGLGMKNPLNKRLINGMTILCSRR